MFILLGGMIMFTKDLRIEVQKLLQEKIGIILYAVLKGDEEKIIKFVNIADEEDVHDNTSQELLDGFSSSLENKLISYDEDNEILKLSSADERANGLYYYDLDELPTEMEMLKKVSNESNNISTFSFNQDSLDKIIAFIIVIGNAQQKLVMYKQQYPISLLKRDRYMLTPIPHSNRLKKFDQDILRIDFNCQFFLLNDVVYILDIEKMERVCSFYNIVVNEAKKSIQAIENMNILDNVEVLSDELDDISFARKLTRVYKDSKVIGNVDNKTIIEFSKWHTYFEKNPLKLNDKMDKFILDTKKSKNAFLKLMNDDLLTSHLTNYNYESLAKNNA